MKKLRQYSGPFRLIVYLVCLLAIIAPKLLLAQGGFTRPMDTVSLEGFISSDQVLSSGKVYIITHNVKVGNNAVLTVEKNSTILFDANTSLVVEGGLILNGAPNAFIHLTSLNRSLDKQGIGILIRGNQGKDVEIQYAKFTRLTIPIRFDLEWFRNNVRIENNVFRELYTGESNVLITSPFMNYEQGLQQTANLNFSNNSFANNWGSIFIENFEDNILNLQFKNNLITNNVVYGIDVGIPSNTPIFGLFDDVESKYAANIRGNSIFGNYQINSSTDTIIREISFGIQGDGEMFNIPGNFFRSKEPNYISNTFDHFYQNSSLPLLKAEPYLIEPEASTPAHIWKVEIEGIEVGNYDRIPQVDRRDISFNVYFNKPVNNYGQTQLESIVYDTLTSELEVKPIIIANTKWGANKESFSFTVPNASFLQNNMGFILITNFMDNQGFEVPEFSIGRKNAINNYRRVETTGIRSGDLISGRGGIIDVEVKGGAYLPTEKSVAALEALVDFGDVSYLEPYRSLEKTWEIGVQFGVSNYMGTLTYKFVNKNEFNFSAGLYGQYNLSKWYSVRAMLWYGKISGNDFFDPDEARQKRLANFKNNLVEGSLTFHWHLLKYGTSRGEKFTPSIYAGVAILRSKPMSQIFLYEDPATKGRSEFGNPIYLTWDKDNNQPVYDGSGDEIWFSLRDIGTEGQTVGGMDPEAFSESEKAEFYANREAPKQYRKVQVSFPLGFAFNWILYNKWNIGAEVGIRVTTTRYLDDIGGYYWDRGSEFNSGGLEYDEDYPWLPKNYHRSIVQANSGTIQGKVKGGGTITVPDQLTFADPNVLTSAGEPVVTTYNTAALLANPSLVQTDQFFGFTRAGDGNLVPIANEASGNPGQFNNAYAFNHGKRANKTRDHYGFIGVKVSKVIRRNPKKTSKKERYKPIKFKDSDKDGLSDDDEKILRTDPKNPDTDGDGLTDGEEVNRYGTDPTKADTDGDGLTDGEEINRYGTNPTKADTDGDGLSDGREVHETKTDPLNPDTDGGGVNDGQEVNQDNTDPLNPNDDRRDRDGDGIIDAEDDCPDQPGLAKFNGCPDSDGDGIEDLLDDCPYEPGPASNRGCPEEEIEEVEAQLQERFRNISFDTNKDVIRPSSFSDLDLAAEQLLKHSNYNVIIEGHTDDVGNDEWNKTLSQQRADAVKRYLINKGVTESRIVAIGYGEERPKASNLTEQGRQENRRVEVRLVKIR